MADDDVLEVTAAEWCSYEEAVDILEAARPGAPSHVDWDRFLSAVDHKGRPGFYRPGIENEAIWQLHSSPLKRAARTVVRSVGKVLAFIFSFNWN